VQASWRLSQLIFFGLVCLGSYCLALAYPMSKDLLSVGVTTRNLGACLTPLLSVPDMDQRPTLMMVLALPSWVIVVEAGCTMVCPRPAPAGSNQ